MYHLGNPCIHCGVPHDDVEPGFCTKAIGLGANVRNIEYMTALLAENEKAFTAERDRIKKMIADQKTIIARVGDGLDLEKIALAETFMYASNHREGGDESICIQRRCASWRLSVENTPRKGIWP